MSETKKIKLQIILCNILGILLYFGGFIGILQSLVKKLPIEIIFFCFICFFIGNDLLNHSALLKIKKYLLEKL